MLSALESPQSKQGLRAIDPDLPLLASEAAIDIENILSNDSTDFTAIRSLAEQLNNSFEASTPGGTLHSLMDPATLTVLSSAVAAAKSQQPLQKVEELLGEAAKIAKVLSSDNPIENPEQLREAQNFCIAFSRAVMAYHKSIYDLSPPHPYRG